jgi:putative ABC transport system permease protein
MKRFSTNLTGSLIEAWQEVRIHKTRVMLSLIGVAVAVCALTTVVGLGAVAQAAIIQNQERDSGRPANLSMSASSMDANQAGLEEVEVVWREALERYDITYATRFVQSQQTIQFADGAVLTQVQGVDVAFATMRRFQLTEGQWFAEDDADRLAPALIVNSVFYDRLGRPDLATHPTTTILGQQDTAAVIIGVYQAAEWEQLPAMYMLADAVTALPPAAGVPGQGPDGGMVPTGYATYDMWVPPAIAEELRTTLERDLQRALGDSASASVYRSDYAAWDSDPYLTAKLMVGGVALLVLLLGALGLVNIALVTLKQRIREIGIRRSFGATAGRVFFAVMMESVVATVVAGIFGVVAAILIVKNPWVEDLIGQGRVSEFPPFPVEAAIIGLAAATLVGALAGLLPALVAVKVKVIDAIRY